MLCHSILSYPVELLELDELDELDELESLEEVVALSPQLTNRSKEKIIRSCLKIPTFLFFE